MRRLIYIVVFALVILVACKKDDGPPPSPESVVLVFPFENSECTTGIDVNESLSQVTFEWEASANTDQYSLNVINLITNVPQQPVTTSSTSVSLSIAKGTPYSWSVNSINSLSGLTATSEEWLFYNAGSQTNYAPFPAQIVHPESGATVQANTSNEILLRWAGADIEDDITTFEIYLSDQNPPQTLVGTVENTVDELFVMVSAGNTYFWRVITTDSEGNTSDSGIFDFKIL